ncbi:MAG: hypothetical protein ABJF10_02075 [Chthoniobacter sp.]|uniref:hypothetical protein n=1 Tax=Chthoniobacter sp. TaxID=2510640 RepID=UPI0032A3850C
MSTPKKPGKPASGRREFRRRDYGKISVIDRLPDPVKAELRTRWENPAISYQKILSWLATEHKTRTSQAALGAFFRRQKETGLLAAAGQEQAGGIPWEVSVFAPGATEIRVTIRPAATGAPAAHPSKA